MAPPQYSQRPLASGMVVAPQKGQVTAVFGGLGGHDAVARLLAQLHQRVADLGCLALGLAVLDGAALIDGGVVHAQVDLGKVRRVDVDGQIKVVIQVVARRDCSSRARHPWSRDRCSVRCSSISISQPSTCENSMMSGLASRQRLCEVMISRPASSSSMILVRPAESVRVGLNEARRCGVRLAVGELLADVVRGAGAIAVEEGGKLAGALFAQVAFVDLGLSQKSQLGTANRALFLLEHLVKEAHGCLPST